MVTFDFDNLEDYIGITSVYTKTIIRNLWIKRYASKSYKSCRKETKSRKHAITLMLGKYIVANSNVKADACRTGVLTYKNWTDNDKKKL